MKVRFASKTVILRKAALAAAACVLIIFLSPLGGCAPKQKLDTGKQVQATRDLGVALMNEGRFRASLREFMRAEELDPKDAQVQDCLGLVLLALQQPKDAVQHFEKAVKLDPKFSKARNNLGNAYLALGEWDKAIGVFGELMSDLVYPTPWKPASGLGWAYYNKGEYKLAEESYLTAVDQSPGFALGWRGLGKVYLAQGRYDKAVRALEKAVDLAPQFAEAYLDLGDTQARAGQRFQAREAYEKVCGLAPESALCDQARARIAGL